MFGCCLVQLTSLTGRLLRLHSLCRWWTWVAWKPYKIRVNRALRLLDASSTLLAVVWTLLGRIWAHFGRPGRLLGCLLGAIFVRFISIFIYFLHTFQERDICIDFELLFQRFRRHRYPKNHVFTAVLQCFFRFWHIQNHVYFHLIFHGFWHAFGYILAHIFKTCSRIVFVYLFDDALRCLLDASGMPLGKFSTPWPPLGCLWAPILSCKTRLNRPLRPP